MTAHSCEEYQVGSQGAEVVGDYLSLVKKQSAGQKARLRVAPIGNRQQHVKTDVVV
jgi:hypothetical protein